MINQNLSKLLVSKDEKHIIRLSLINFTKHEINSSKVLNFSMHVKEKKPPLVLHIRKTNEESKLSIYFSKNCKQPDYLNHDFNYDELDYEP